MSHKIKLGLTLRLPGESDDELLNNNSHANTDKERRNRIRALFGDLHAMLPNAPPQVHLSSASTLKLQFTSL